MIKVENIDTWGFEHAIRGMRNPLNSWNKSDSRHANKLDSQTIQDMREGMFILGENDLDLMRRLYKAGTEHRKYLRQIFVSMDITAPDYYFKEFSTYKVGVVENSTSTMHKIAEKEFTLDDFSHEHLISTFEYSKDSEDEITDDYLDEFCLLDDGSVEGLSCTYMAGEVAPIYILDWTIAMLNRARELFLKTKNKKYWWQMIQLLPMTYNYRRTVTMNYENVMSMINQRTGHKLDEWNTFVDILKSLPYIKEIRGESDG